MDFETYYKQLQGSTEPTPSGKHDDSFNAYYDQLRMDSGIIPDPKKIPLNSNQQHALEVEQSDMAQMDQARRASNPQEQPVEPIQANEPPSNTSWNSLLDNPITHGAETGLSWAIKPFESISTGIADTVGATKNLFGSEKRTGFDGNEYVSTPSESRNLVGDLKNIWSQTHSDTSSEAWKSAFPNLGKMKGTDVKWTDVLDFGAQSVPLDVGPLLKGAKLGVKGLSEAGLAAERGLAQATVKPSLGTAVDDFVKRVNSSSAPLPSGRITETVGGLDNSVMNQAADSFKRIESPTIARIEPKNTYYAERLDELFNAAKQEQLPPGREREALDDLWSRMAGPNDPNLDQLIELGTPTLKQLERTTPTPDMLSRARNQQSQREVAGVPLPVKSEYDRGLRFSQGNLSTSREPSVLRSEPMPQSKLNEPGSTAGQIKGAFNALGQGVKEAGNAQRAKELSAKGFLEYKNPAVADLFESQNPGFIHRVEDGKDRFYPMNEAPKTETKLSLTSDEFDQLLRGGRIDEVKPLDRLRSEPIADPNLTGKPMAEISQPNNPDTIISRLGETVKGDQNLGINAFGKRAGMYDNLSTDTKSQLVSKTAREPINVRDVTDAGYRKMVDDQYRFKDFDNHAEKVLGRKLNPSEQTHTLALNSRGSDMITHHILTQDLVDINGNVIGRSLKNATQQIPKNKLVDFEDYQVLRHSMFRMDRKEKVYHDRLEMTPDKAAQKVAAYEAANPNFKDIADELYGFRRNLVKSWLVDTGLVARKTWDGVIENNPFYVSNNRQFLSTEKGGGGAKKGFARQSSPLKPAPGSQRKIISPTESDIEHVDQYVKAGKRNQVMQNVVKIAQKDPEAFEGFLEIMPMTDNIKQSELNKLNAIIERDGVEGLIENINNQFDQMFNEAKVAGKKDLNNTIPVMFNGEPVWVKVHDAPFLEALTNLTPQAQGYILEGARNWTRVMKMLTTGVNPVFSLTRNLVRDVPMSYVASKTTDNPLRFGWDFLDSTISILGNKEMYKSFKAIGGGHSSSIAADRNMLAQSKREILPQRNIKSLPARILSGAENFTNALETAPRLGEYKRLTRSGNNSPDSKIRGLYEANDVTVNFKRRGNVGREIDAFVPYFNAAIQGLDKTFRTIKDRPMAAVLKAVGAISVPSMILYAINYNDPDYKKLDDRTKDMNYLIPNGDGTFTKLPKPREGGAVFGSSLERVMRKFYEGDPDAFRDFAETIRYSFTPPVVSGFTKPGSFLDKLEAGFVGDSILGPLSDIKSNKDFAERPIVPRYMEGLSPELQYDERTSELSKWIGRQINASPKQLDYLIKSYSGIIGQLGIPLNSEGGSLLKALKQQVTADPTYSNSVFTDFYDLKDKLDTAEKDYQQTGKESPDYNRADQLFLGRVSRQISKVRTTMQEVQSDNSLSREQKDNKLKELQVLVTSIAEDANNELKPKAAK